jgi:DNA-binding CsgD family transcriptional regulator
LKICDFVNSELDYIRSEANFTNDEMILFNMRANNIPLEECAERMNISVPTVKRISQRVNKKIEKEI